MKQYINKDALVAEINRVLNSYDPNEITSGRYALVDLRDFINNLKVKEVQEEPVSEDLEEAAKHYLYSNILYDDVYVGNPTDKDCIEMFKAGAKWQKEQMLKKSFGATVCKYLNTFLKEMDKDAISQALREYTNGDRVRVLIIKQE